MNRTKLLLYITLGLSVFAGGYFTGKQHKPKTEIKEVVKVQERVRTRTVIKERPDGTKETIIVEDRRTDSKATKVVQTGANRYSIGYFNSLKSREEPIHGLQITRRILGDFSIGVYGRTDKEYGVLIRYDF